MKQSISGTTQIYGLIGDPVEHSFSPPMMNAVFSYMNLDACYLAFQVDEKKVSEAIAGIRALNFAGVNVTVPHKSAVIPYLDEVSPLAKKIGAVNTISNVKGRLKGTNTDFSGFLRSLKTLNFSPKKKTIALLGSGGSARALVAGLADAGALRVMLHNRTAERAEKLVTEFSRYFPLTQLEAVSLQTIHETPLDLLVNTTTVGMFSSDLPLDLKKCRKINLLADIIYRPSQTPLLKQAKELGINAVNGIDMLLYQGCDAFTFWTGKQAPEEVMRSKLLSLIE
ncbi:MAG: shikimate dehydrogenase [SAR324 cluster bacterium]|nr:shikimate dehydrogenase [SAR324 cluster bacterium]